MKTCDELDVDIDMMEFGCELIQYAKVVEFTIFCTGLAMEMAGIREYARNITRTNIDDAYERAYSKRWLADACGDNTFYLRECCGISNSLVQTLTAFHEFRESSNLLACAYDVYFTLYKVVMTTDDETYYYIGEEMNNWMRKAITDQFNNDRGWTRSHNLGKN